MNTNKIIAITSDDRVVEIEYQKAYNLREETWINTASAIAGTPVKAIYNGNTHHVCKYCGQVTEGTLSDLLCNECRELFGHALYSEL